LKNRKSRSAEFGLSSKKARQLGISTYVSGRFFHRCLFEPGLRTFILGHERRASTNLFEMVKRFYEHLPVDVRPATGTFNSETLLFNNDSGYIVSVATLDGAGRSLRHSCCTLPRQHSGQTLKRRSLHCFRSYLTLMDQRPLSKARRTATTTFTNSGALPKAAHRNGCRSSYRGH
jgi:hypothetical protein